MNNEKVKVEVLEEAKNEIAVVDPNEGSRFDPNPLPTEYRTLSMEVLVPHVYSFGSGGNKVTGLDAAGIRFVASIMGLSIEECDITELPNGEGLIGKAKAVDKNGRSYYGISQQPYKTKNGKVDQYAWEKCNTKAQRNAFMGLIPAPLINQAINYTEDPGSSMMDNPLAMAKSKARSSVQKAKKRLQEIGLTPQDIFDQAEFVYGSASEWTLSQWQSFESDVRLHKRCEWIQNLAKNKEKY